MDETKIILLIMYFAWNMIVLFLYRADKRKAKCHEWRVSENTLLLSAILMGGIGAFLGMKAFHHKTKHPKFKIGVPLAVLLNIAVIATVYYWKVI